MKFLTMMIEVEENVYRIKNNYTEINAENATKLKILATRLIKTGKLEHGFYIASPSNGRNKVWKL